MKMRQSAFLLRSLGNRWKTMMMTIMNKKKNTKNLLLSKIEMFTISNPILTNSKKSSKPHKDTPSILMKETTISSSHLSNHQETSSITNRDHLCKESHRAKLSSMKEMTGRIASLTIQSKGRSKTFLSTTEKTRFQDTPRKR